MSNLWRYVKLMKVCQTFEGMSKYEGLSKLKGYVKIAYESMSNFWWYVKLSKVKTYKSMSYL